MDQPWFSVVIPCYNSAPYIDATLKSLYEQSYNDFEVIIVDDGSTDDSLDACNKALTKYSLNGKLIGRSSDKIKGVASCRNIGIKHAKADWICFLDSDDLFLPAKLQKMHELTARYGQHVWAYHHALRNFEDGTDRTLTITSRDHDETPRNILPELLNVNIIATSTVTISRQLFESLGGFDTSLHGIEDYMLWLRASKKTNWCYSNEVLTDYRVRTTSLMGGRQMEHYVTQNSMLIKKATASGEFTQAELDSVERYLFGDIMSYYAMVSINSWGWNDFLKGLAVMAKTGRKALAMRLFLKFSKRQLLGAASKLKSK